MATPAPPAAEHKKPAPPPAKDAKPTGQKAAAGQDKANVGKAVAGDKASAGQQRFDRMAVRAKLAVSEPGDAVEREADAIADKVMRMPEQPAAAQGKAPPAPAVPAVGKPEGVRRKESPTGKGALDSTAAGASHETGRPAAPKAPQATVAAPPQAAPKPPGGAAPDRAGEPIRRKENVPESPADSSRQHAENPAGPQPVSTQQLVERLGSGEPLDADVRARFERSMGADFSHVRIHTDAAAAQSARQIHARAFTYGSHIAFASGAYNPDGGAGKHLLAHELAHVMQQDEGSVSRMIMRAPAGAAASSDFEVTHAELEVPPIKSRHIGGYRAKAGKGLLKRKGAYDASTRGTKQVTLWTGGVKIDINKIPSARRPSATAGFDLSLDVKGGASAKVIKAGSLDELTRVLQIPTWDAAGSDVQFQVDHMVEYQLGGEDALDNMELLNQAHNGSVGSSFSHGIKRTVREEIQKDPGKPALTGYSGPKNAAGEPTAEGVMEAMTVVFKKVKGRARESGRKEGGSMFWSKQQIEALDHVLPQLGGSGNLKGDANDFALLSPTGNLLIARLHHGNGKNTITISGSQMGGMAGFKMKRLVLIDKYNDAAAGANIGTLEGELNFGPAVAIPPGSVSVGVAQARNPGEHSGKVGSTAGAGLPNEVDFKPMSPLALSDITLGKSVFGRATLKPSHPALSGVEIPAQIMDGKLGLFYTLDATALAGKLNIPGVRIDSAGITLGYDGKDFSVGGGTEFTIQKFGTGFLNASADTSGDFALEGGLRADKRLFDQADMKLWYRKKGGFGGIGTLAITKPGKIKGIKSAKLDAKYEDSVFSAKGEVIPDIPGLKAASLSVSYDSVASELVISGQLAIDDKVPGVEQANITVTVKQVNDAWKVAAEGEVTPKLPGLSGAQLKFSYNDGFVLLEGEFALKKGPLDGKFMAGITNAEVDEKTGKRGTTGSGSTFRVYGAADIQADFYKDKLTGKLKLRLLADGSIRVGGKLTVNDFQVFPKLPEKDEFLNKTIKTPRVPLPGLGFSVGSASVGVTFWASATAKAHASVGPGMMKAISLEIKEFNPADIDFDSLEIGGSATFEVPANAGASVNGKLNMGFSALVVDLIGSVGIEGKVGIPEEKQPVLSAKSEFTYSPAKGLDISNTLNLNLQPSMSFRLFGEISAELNVLVGSITVWSHDFTLAEANWRLPIGIHANGSLGYNTKTGKLSSEPSDAIKVKEPELSQDDFLDILAGDSNPSEIVTRDEHGNVITDFSEMVCEAPAEPNASFLEPEQNFSSMEDMGDASTPGQTVMPQREAAAGPASVDENIVARLGEGAPLDLATRGFFEQRLQADLSRVRIHTGAAAAREARQLAARAFTVGGHIAFAAGEYQPYSEAGRQLLAHELAHVLQQQGSAARQLMREGEGAASAPAASVPPPAAGAAAPAVTSPRGPISLPELKLPELKYSTADQNSHRKAAYDAALAANIERPAGYRRAEVDSRQRTLWTGATPAATLRTQLASKVPGLEAEKVYVAVPRSLTLAAAGAQVIVGTPNEIALALRQPRWDRQGHADPHPFEIDHIVELQIGGASYDRLDNLELLERTANGASGRAIDGFMDEAFAAYARSSEAGALPEADRTAEVLKRQYRVRFAGFSAQGAPTTGKRWTLAEVQAADPAEGLRIYDPGNLTGTAPSDPNAILHPWPAGVDPARFTGSPSLLVLYASARGGEPRQVPLRDGQPDDPARVLAGWLPGIDTRDLSLTLSGSADGPIGRIRGQLNHPQLAESSRIEVDIPIRRRRGLANAGILNTDTLLERLRSLLREGGVTAFSPVVVDEVDVLPGVGLYVAGRVEPTIAMIRNASLDFQIRGDELVVSRTFYGGDIELGGPFRIDGSDLTVGLGTRSGLQIGGGIAFGIEHLGQGTLRGAGRSGEFAIDGDFAFDRSLFDADASIALSYRRSAEAPDGKLAGSGTVSIGAGKVRGIRRATVQAAFDGENRSLSGTAELDIPGVESATLGVQFTPEGGTTISGSARFRDRPGIRNGQISATLAEGADGWTMAARGSAESTFSGVSATLDASYDNGLFRFSAEAPFAAGPASGSVLLGVTNGDVDDNGNITGEGGGSELRGFGNGTVNVRLTEHLQGGVGLKVRPGGDILISGRVGIPGSVTLFEQYPSAERSRRELFRLPTLSIPLVGFAVGGNTVGVALTINGRVTGYAHIGPGLLTRAEVRIDDYNPAQPESLRVSGGATFDLPAAAGVEAGLDAGVSLGAAVVRATAGLNVTAAAGVEAHVTPSVDIDWTPRDGLHLHADLNASLSPQLRFGLNGYAEVVADAFVTSFTLWRKDWALADRTLGSSLSLGLNVPVDYYSDARGVVFDPEQVSLQVPELNRDTFSQLLNDEGSERVERAAPGDGATRPA